jgi:hypothetical protein
VVARLPGRRARTANGHSRLDAVLTARRDLLTAAQGNWTLRHGSGAIYTLSTRPASFSAAQAACLAQGSHLVSYTSAAEQADVEGYFIALGGHKDGPAVRRGLRPVQASHPRLQRQPALHLCSAARWRPCCPAAAACTDDSSHWPMCH